MKTDYSQYMAWDESMTGKRFCKLTDNAPPELYALILDIHTNLFDKCLPNNWIYETIEQALSALHWDDLDDITIESDIYNSELVEWFRNGYADSFIDEYLEECTPDARPTKIMEILGCGQWLAKMRIYAEVNDWLIQQANKQNLQTDTQ